MTDTTPTTEQDDEHLRESLLLVTGMCNGPFDFPHRCSAMHCNHCGLCDVSEDLIKVCNAYAERKVVEALVDELNRVKSILTDYNAPYSIVDRLEDDRGEVVWTENVKEYINNRLATLSPKPEQKD